MTKDLEKMFQDLVDFSGNQTIQSETQKTIAALGLAILRFDKTSARLARANIIIGIALGLLGIVQIGLVVWQIYHPTAHY